VSKDGGSRQDRKVSQHLDPGESFLSAATFNTGSITRAAVRGVSAPIVKLVLTDRRVILFSTSNLAFNLNFGKLLRSIPLSEIGSVESSKARMVGVSGMRLGMNLTDGSVLEFEASGLTLASAKRLVPVLEATVISHNAT
jgi:hypothetical protein